MGNFQRRMRPLLGTYVEIGAVVSGTSCAAVDNAFLAIEKIQDLLSFHDPASDLSRLNAAEGSEIQLHPLSARVLRLAKYMTAASNGLFNCTVGGALVHRGLLPNHDISRSLLVGNSTDLDITGSKAKLHRRVKITLDGVAKGFAVDLGIRALKKSGCEAGYINAGGDLRVFGNLSLPVLRRESEDAVATLGKLTNMALATSQTRARPNRRFPGVIVGTADSVPEPGTWSVFAKTAWRADALTKVAANASTSQRHSIVRALGGRLL